MKLLILSTIVSLTFAINTGRAAWVWDGGSDVNVSDDSYDDNGSSTVEAGVSATESELSVSGTMEAFVHSNPELQNTSIASDEEAYAFGGSSYHWDGGGTSTSVPVHYTLEISGSLLSSAYGSAVATNDTPPTVESDAQADVTAESGDFRTRRIFGTIADGLGVAGEWPDSESAASELSTNTSDESVTNWGIGGSEPDIFNNTVAYMTFYAEADFTYGVTIDFGYTIPAGESSIDFGVLFDVDADLDVSTTFSGGPHSYVNGESEADAQLVGSLVITISP